MRSMFKRLLHNFTLMRWHGRYRIAPPRAVFRGQVLGLIAVVAVLFFAGYLAYLNHPWRAGLVAGVDIVALASVFVARGRDR